MLFRSNENKSRYARKLSKEKSRPDRKSGGRSEQASVVVRAFAKEHERSK